MDLVYNNNVQQSFTRMIHEVNTKVITYINYLSNFHAPENLLNLEIIYSVEKKLKISKHEDINV